MKKNRNLGIAISVSVCLICCSGCSTLVKSVSGKSVSTKGYGSVNIVDTGANPTTGTLTPHLTNIVGSVHHKSTIVAIENSQKTPDYVDYAREESASVFNSSAKTTTISFTISASSRDAAEKYLDKIKSIEEANLKNNGK